MKKTSVLIPLLTFMLAGCQTNAEPVHEHSFGAWIIDVNPTLTETGSAHRECECEEKETVTLPVLTDTSVWTVTSIAPTCTTPGSDKYQSVYGEVSIPKEALGHEYGEPTYSWNEDNSKCTAQMVCARDSSHVISEEATSTSEITTPASCSAAGEKTFTATFQNSAFETQTKVVPIDKLDHDYGVPTYTWNDDNSKCTAQAVCQSNSSHVLTEEVTSTSEITTPATCEEAGERTFTANFENEIFETQTKVVPVEKLNHQYGEPTYVWNEDNSKCTAQMVCAHDATHVISEEATSTNEVTTPATCLAEGERTFTATFANEAFETQTKVVPVAKLDHNYVNGHGYVACSGCGLVQSINPAVACSSPLITYFDKAVGTIDGLFGGWTSGNFKVTEISNDIVWMGKVDDAYGDQWFNANNTVDNFIYDVYLRTPDSGEVTQCQLYFGANGKKYAVPVYSNGGINLYDCHNEPNGFVDGAFRNFPFEANKAYHVQMIYFDLGSNKAQLTWIIDGKVINSLEIDSIADQRNFGFDVNAGANWELGSPNIYIMHNYVDSGNGYSACVCGKAIINENHKAGASLLKYEGKEVGATEGLFGDWTSGNFRITEISNGIVWMGKVNGDYKDQWFNAGDDTDHGWVAAENFVYDVYLRTPDSGEVTQCQLYFGANGKKYAVPVYSNGGINLYDCHNEPNGFVDGAFRNFAFQANKAVHVQLVYVEKGSSKAQLSYIIDGLLIHTFEIDSIADQRNFGFDVSAGANWEIGSPNIFVLD